MKTQTVTEIIRDIVGSDTSMSEPRRLLATEGMQFNGVSISHLAEEFDIAQGCTFIVGDRRWVFHDDDWIRLPDGATIGIEEGEVSLLFGHCYLVCAEAPAPCDYVRLVTRTPPYVEIGYWVSDEWRDEPEEVMGAIIGALIAQSNVSISPSGITVKSS